MYPKNLFPKNRRLHGHISTGDLPFAFSASHQPLTALTALATAQRLVLGAALLLLPALAHGQDGVVLQRRLVHDGSGGSLRSYLLYVPAAYDGQEAWPLVIDYHPYTRTSAFQMNLDRMDLVADTAHFLIAYPQGLRIDDPMDGLGIGWNFDGRVSSNDDVDFTSQLIDHVMEDFVIDPARVHATGMSSGSQMIWAVACGLSDRIASVAGVSGPIDEDFKATCDAGRPYSAMLIFGTADRFWPPDGAEAGPYVWANPQETTDFWGRQNNCSPEPRSEDLEDVDEQDGSSVTLLTYTACDVDSEVLYFRVRNGGHAWPGGSRPSSTFFGIVNRDISATAEIVEFLLRNPHPMMGTPIEQETTQGGMFRIGLAYPNPFGAATTLRLELADDAHVRLVVYDVLGRDVAVLADGPMKAGRHAVRFDASGLPSGTYLVRLTAEGGLAATQRLTVLR